MLRVVVLIQYRQVTDGQTDRQTDGIAIASTALAMRALWRAVMKDSRKHKIYRQFVHVTRNSSTSFVSKRLKVTVTTRSHNALRQSGYYFTQEQKVIVFEFV